MELGLDLESCVCGIGGETAQDREFCNELCLGVWGVRILLLPSFMDAIFRA